MSLHLKCPSCGGKMWNVTDPKIECPMCRRKHGKKVMMNPFRRSEQDKGLFPEVVEAGHYPEKIQSSEQIQSSDKKEAEK